MSADLIQGKKGGGKSKLAVMLIKAHLADGLQVATNLDLFLEKLMPPMSKATVLRIPDKPTSEHLRMCGIGNLRDRYAPEFDGLMVLDELATWMNARTYQDKDRMAVMDFLVHSRKRNWWTMLICQDLSQIDKQARESQVEYVTRCKAMHRFRIPFIGWLIAALFGPKAAYMPKFHRAARRMGVDPKGLVAQSWWYTTGGVQAGYDTLQEFQDNYEHGPHSLLSAWHLVGRFLPQRKPLLQQVREWFALPARPLPTSAKRPLVVKLQDWLPADERIRHARRLLRLNLL